MGWWKIFLRIKLPKISEGLGSSQYKKFEIYAIMKNKHHQLNRLRLCGVFQIKMYICMFVKNACSLVKTHFTPYSVWAVDQGIWWKIRTSFLAGVPILMTAHLLRVLSRLKIKTQNWIRTKTSANTDTRNILFVG